MSPQRQPLATYRIQFNPQFRFADARALVPYLSRLGITHVYCSPLLRARTDSQHGYDVVDPTTLNPQIGDESEFRALVSALRAHGLGTVLDIVPNHMAASSENRYWHDVLTYGISSPYARWFDIDWRLPDPELWGRVQVPVLGRPLPAVLANDELRIAWREGRFVVVYFDHVFPIDPATVPRICAFGLADLNHSLESDHPVLGEIRPVLKSLARLPSRTARTRRRRALDRDAAEALLSRLAQLIEQSPLVHDWAQRTAQRFCADAEGRDRLRKLLATQSYRLVYWRQAARVLNYRRFFDINDLISVRQEVPEVFDARHALIARFIHQGLLDGLRIDHIDGLRAPRLYLVRLASKVGEQLRTPHEFPIFVEKILARSERLPDDWPVAGTTGYEFINELEELFISPAGFAKIEHNYHSLAPRPPDFQHAASSGKRRVLKAELSAFVGRLADMLERLARGDPDFAGVTETELIDAIVETVVALPVYRTYFNAHESGLRVEDRAALEKALAGARSVQRASPRALDCLNRVLLGHSAPEVTDAQRQDRANFIERFQQLTGPAAAKGVEDTALYSYVPLVSRNEVGGGPDAPLDDAPHTLHAANLERSTAWPQTMLAATTHDTKRSADVRSRLDVLSELPDQWIRTVKTWMRWNRPLRARVHGKRAPDAAAEYLLYQTLVGIWPAASSDLAGQGIPSAQQLTSLTQRTQQYMLKAAREAKTRTSWAQGDADYEQCLTNFIGNLLRADAAAPSRFLADLQHFADKVARPGFWNALARTLVQFTAPGTPDLYQGDELWNFCLVDPDNRRPVDYAQRQALLDELAAGFESPADSRSEFIRKLVEYPEDGRVKLHLVRCALHARRSHPDVFAAGSYLPLEVVGQHCAHVFAFARQAGATTIVTVVPRLTVSLVGATGAAPLGHAVWQDTALVLPPELVAGTWESILTRETLSTGSGARAQRLPLADCLSTFPVALLVSASSPGADHITEK